MKFISDRQRLSEALTVISRAVSQKTNLTALEGVQIKASENSLTLTGYDLEVGITTSFEAEVSEEGVIVINAKILGDIVKRLPDERVSFSSDERFLVEVTSGESQFTIMGVSPEDFPRLPDITNNNSFSVDQVLLKEMLSDISFAISVSDERPIHTGALFNVEEGVLSVVGVDGHRLAVRNEPVSCSENIRFVLPRGSVNEMIRLLGCAQEVEIGVSGRHITFDLGEYFFISRLLSGEFLNYNNSVPKEHKLDITVKTREAIDALERVSLIISDRVKSPVRLEFKKTHMNMNCQTALGKAGDRIPLSREDDEDLLIAFNSRYIIEALKATKADSVRFLMTSPTTPLKIVPMEGDSFLILVLPVRMTN